MSRDLLGRAQEYLCKGEYRKALEIYERLEKVISNPKELGDIFYHISLCHMCMDNDEIALKYVRNAMDMHSKVGDFSALARDMLQYAILEKNERKVRELIDESIVLATKAGDFETIIEAINTLAFLEKSEEKMLERVKKAYELARESGSRSGELISLYTMGRILYDMNRTKEAMKAVEKALKLIEDDGVGEEYYREIYELAELVGVRYGKRGDKKYS